MKGCRPLSDVEVASVLEQLGSHRYPARDRALFLLGLRSGFRISELLSLTVGDVFQNGNFVDRVSVARRHMKKKMEGRTVALHPEARTAVETWVRELAAAGHTHPHTYVFRSREGANRALNRRSAWAMLKKAYGARGLTGKTGTHSMRKTFAKRIHEKLGRDIMKTQKALGHARITSTCSYLSFAEEEVEDAILKS